MITYILFKTNFYYLYTQYNKEKSIYHVSGWRKGIEDAIYNEKFISLTNEEFNKLAFIGGPKVIYKSNIPLDLNKYPELLI